MTFDIELSSIVDIERRIIENAEKIEKISSNLNVSGRVSKKAIAIGLGIYHDAYQRELLYKSIGMLKCLEKVKNGYKIKIHHLLNVDDTELIKSDPILSLMEDLMKNESMLDISIDEENICGSCNYFDDVNGYCITKDKEVNKNSIACPDIYRSKRATMLRNSGV